MNPVVMNQVVKRYGETLALDHFSLEAEKGKVLGLLGPNGSGKTTAIHCMLGVLRYDKGEIQVFGKGLKNDDYESKRRIGLVPQELAFFDKLTVLENLDYFGGLYLSKKDKRKAYVEEALAFVGLEEHRKVMAKNLSGGLKRRLNIACGIVHKPELIFFDEPTVAVDAQSRNFILEGIREMGNQGATIIYTTHYLEEAETLCDNILIMDKGKNLVQGTMDELISMISTSEKISFSLIKSVQGLREKLQGLPYLLNLQKNDNTYLLSFENGSHNMANLLHLLEEEGLVYDKLFSEKPSLSDVFLSLTGKELRE